MASKADHTFEHEGLALKLVLGELTQRQVEDWQADIRWQRQLRKLDTLKDKIESIRVTASRKSKGSESADAVAKSLLNFSQDVLSRDSNEEYLGMALRAAIRAGWVKEPALDAETVDEMPPREVAWLGQQVLAFHRQALEIPKN